MKNYKIHIIFWVLFFWYTCLIDYNTGEFKGVVPQLVYFLSHHLLIFYVSYYSINRIERQQRNKSITAILLVLGSFILFMASHFFFRIYIFKHFIPNYPPLADYSQYFWKGVPWFSQFFFIAAGFIFFEKRRTAEDKLKVSERHLLETESNFLRAQINPHFLQNMLNFFYAQSIQGKSKELSEGILVLSDMMRYSLQTQGDSSARVPLQDEIQHLQNYIDINQMRFDNQLQVTFEKSGHTDGYTIIPLVLLTLLENSFKHGHLHDAAHPLEVKVNVNQAKNELVFSTYNKVKNGPKEISTGLGIENTRRRLQAAFPGRYTLKTNEENGFFHASLSIKLDK